MIDNPSLDKKEVQKLLKRYGILKHALQKLLMDCQLSDEVRKIALEPFDKIGFFDNLNGGEGLRERWSHNPKK